MSHELRDRWTLGANKRRGLEGAPMVLDGPRMRDLYGTVVVVPEAEVKRVQEALRIVFDNAVLLTNTDEPDVKEALSLAQSLRRSIYA